MKGAVLDLTLLWSAIFVMRDPRTISLHAVIRKAARVSLRPVSPVVYKRIWETIGDFRVVSSSAYGYYVQVDSNTIRNIRYKLIFLFLDLFVSLPYETVTYTQVWRAVGRGRSRWIVPDTGPP